MGGASSHSAPHTAIAAIAEALQGRRSHPRWTDVAAGTPGAQKEEYKEVQLTSHDRSGGVG